MRYNLVVKWQGEDSEFARFGKEYIAQKSQKTEHYFFLNERNERDCASIKFFILIKKRRNKNFPARSKRGIDGRRCGNADTKNTRIKTGSVDFPYRNVDQGFREGSLLIKWQVGDERPTRPSK